MTTLVVLLPSRSRHLAAERPAEPTSDEYTYVVTGDGSTVVATGRCAASLLPQCDVVVAVIGDHDASWHRLPIPKAPSSKMRAALIGAMEEQLLDEADNVHLALEPAAAGGAEAWVCAVNKPWLVDAIARLEVDGRVVDRVVPLSWPEDTPLGHFSESRSTGNAREGHAPLQLTWSDVSGVATIQLQGSLAKTLLPQWSTSPARWSAHPSIAAQAERWLGATVIALRDEARALQAMRSLWNLRQFDMAPRHRGALALRDAWKRFLGADWRAARYGLAALVALNLLGLNLWAWHLNGQIADKRASMDRVLRDAHPQVKSVLDAPVQMQRETDALRAAAGRLGDADLETVLGAMAAAWPDGRAPVETLRFEGGTLSVSSAGWTDAQVAQLRDSLRPAGWAVQQANGALSLSRNRTPGVS